MKKIRLLLKTFWKDLKMKVFRWGCCDPENINAGHPIYNSMIYVRPENPINYTGECYSFDFSSVGEGLGCGPYYARDGKLKSSEYRRKLFFWMRPFDVFRLFGYIPSSYLSNSYTPPTNSEITYYLNQSSASGVGADIIDYDSYGCIGGSNGDGTGYGIESKPFIRSLKSGDIAQCRYEVTINGDVTEHYNADKLLETQLKYRKHLKS